MMRTLGSFRRSVLLLSTVVVLASIAIVGVLQASGAGRSPEDPMERLALRLHDLPPGYFPLDFSEGNGIEFTCEELNPSNPSPNLAGFVERFSPHGCLGIYLRAYRIPGAALTPRSGSSRSSTWGARLLRSTSTAAATAPSQHVAPSTHWPE